MATKPEKLPSGNWRCRGMIYVDGKRKFKSFTADTRKECAYMASQYELEGKRHKEVPRLTVGEAIDKYIDDRTEILSASTIRGYRKYRKCYLQLLMDMPLASLSAQVVQKAINIEAAQHSPKTIRNALGLFSAAISPHVPDITRNVDLPQPIKYDAIIPDDIAVQNLVQLTRGKQLGSAILLGAFAGLRRSEIAALKMSDIDTLDNTITVNKDTVMNEHNEYVVKPPKSYAGTRKCTVPQFVIDEIIKNHVETSEYVVGMTPSAITNAFERVRKKAGVTCRFHDLRHYMASIMLALGVPDKYAMEIMGHSTPDMLKRVYQHTMTQKKKEVKNRIVEYFEQNCATNCAMNLDDD